MQAARAALPAPQAAARRAPARGAGAGSAWCEAQLERPRAQVRAVAACQHDVADAGAVWEHRERAVRGLHQARVRPVRQGAPPIPRVDSARCWTPMSAHRWCSATQEHQAACMEHCDWCPDAQATGLQGCQQG